MNSYDYPNGTVFSGEKFVAVLVARPTDDKSEVYTCPDVSPEFGPLPRVNFTTISYLIGDHPFAINCYAIARVKLREGSYTSPSSRVSARGITETVLSTPTMLDVMAKMVAINTTNAQMWGNLEGYVRGVLMLSYQETWNAMTVEFERRMRESEFRPPREIVVAEVSNISLSVWFGFNLGVVIAGVFLFFLQKTVNGKPVTDKTAAALTMDLSPLLDMIPDLTDIAVLGEPEKDLAKLMFSGADVAMRQVVEVGEMM